MKKLLICVAGIGLVAGVIYWLYNEDKSHKIMTKTSDSMKNVKLNEKEEPVSNKQDIVEEMFEAKSNSAKAVNERHSEASKIMKDAYSNIMEDFVEDFSYENSTKYKSKDSILDDESAVMKELDSISDELDDLLK